MYRRILICLCIILNAGDSSVWASPQSKGNESFDGRQTWYLRDASKSLSITDILTPAKQALFIKSKQETLNFRSTNDAVWIKIPVQLHRDSKDFLVVGHPNLDSVDFYYAPDGDMRHISTGSILETGRPHAYGSSFAFDLSDSRIPRDTLVYCYLRIRTEVIMLIPLKIEPGAAMIAGFREKEAWGAFYIGILVIMLVYHAFLYYSTKDKSYISYVFYILFHGCYTLFFLSGYRYILPPSADRLFAYYPHMFGALAFMASAQFCDQVLELRTRMPRFHKTIPYLYAGGVLIILVSLFGSRHAASLLVQVGSIGGSLFILLIAIRSVESGYRPARFYLSAWSGMIAAIFLTVCTYYNILPYRDFSYHYLPAALSLEILLLSFGLGARILLLRRERNRAREKNRLLITDRNRYLEEKVAEKTQELQDAMEKLNENITIKDRLFSIIAHDLRSPIGNLAGVINMSRQGLLESDESKAIYDKLYVDVEQFRKTLDNLLSWSLSQMNAIPNASRELDLHTFFERTVALYQEVARVKKVELKLSDCSATIFTDEDQLSVVLRNLIDNAIKFTYAGGVITVGCSIEGAGVEVYVSNTAEAISEELRERLLRSNTFVSSRGTGNEKGTGLGLQLCKDFIRNLGGELAISNRDGLVVFHFNLPKDRHQAARAEGAASSAAN